MSNSKLQYLLILTTLLLLIPGISGLIAAEGHKPENAANKSDAVVHGTVSSIAGSGEVKEHHPVEIEVIEVFKGDTNSDTVTVQVKGTERMIVSTAAQFTEDEEVVVMLKERNNHYYMTTGYATKYDVENGSIELLDPERKNITVDEMQSIVENSSMPSQNSSISEEPVTDKGEKTSWITSVTDLFEGLYQFIRNL